MIHSMCNYHIWFHDEKAGYVAECRQCKKMQVCFGNILLDMTVKDFKDFYEYIATIKEEKKHIPDRQKKSIILSTPCTALSIILTPEELDALYKMTDYADTEMKAASLIEMFTV